MSGKNNIPKHIAIIMDGNGRWAKDRGLPRTAGHKAGIERVREIIDYARQSGIQALTFFTFSTENWDRPKREIGLLMRYLNNFLDKELKNLDKNNIRLMCIGEGDPLPRGLQAKIREAELKTRDNTGLIVVLALNYGARQEIVEAVKKFTDAVLKGRVTPEGLDSEEFSRYLYTAGLPDPDLLIRTSGEMRLSNFLLWQLSYAELYFSRKYWPDFGRGELEKAIAAYRRRERRFGRIDANKENN